MIKGDRAMIRDNNTQNFILFNLFKILLKNDLLTPWNFGPGCPIPLGGVPELFYKQNFRFLEQLGWFYKIYIPPYVLMNPWKVSPPLMSQIQPVGIDSSQCSRAILLMKVSDFLNNQADFINMQSVPCPDETLKVWALLINPLGRSCASYIAIRSVPPAPPPLYRRLARLW